MKSALQLDDVLWPLGSARVVFAQYQAACLGCCDLIPVFVDFRVVSPCLTPGEGVGHELVLLSLRRQCNLGLLIRLSQDPSSGLLQLLQVEFFALGLRAVGVSHRSFQSVDE